MEKIKFHLNEAVSDTLFITLYAKAVESKKKDPLIMDHTACELVEKIDYDFSKFKGKKASSVGTALRASYFDKVTREYIANHERPVVVLLGCGLDARVNRIGEAGHKAIFYELDIEEVINLRRQLIPPGKKEHLLSASILETDWMDELPVNHPQGDFLFIIEGVLMYFTEAQNQTIFKALAARFPGADIYFDMLNKWMSNRSALHDTVSKTPAKFKFGLDDVSAIESWHPRLKYKSVCLMKDFKGWRKVGFLVSLLMCIPVFKTNIRLTGYHIEKE